MSRERRAHSGSELGRGDAGPGDDADEVRLAGMAIEGRGFRTGEEHRPGSRRVAGRRSGDAHDGEGRERLADETNLVADAKSGGPGHTSTEHELVRSARRVTRKKLEGREYRALPAVAGERLGARAGGYLAVGQRERDGHRLVRDGIAYAGDVPERRRHGGGDTSVAREGENVGCRVLAAAGGERDVRLARDDDGRCCEALGWDRRVFPCFSDRERPGDDRGGDDQRDEDSDDRRRSVPEGGKELPHRRSSPECAASPRRRRIAASSPASGASIWTTSFPRSRSKTRSAWAATVGSWVTTTTV